MTDEPYADGKTISIGVRDVGMWMSRPYEEDDDYPEWEDQKKYENKLREFVKRQPWGSQVKEVFADQEEKAWATFGVVI